MALQMKQTDEQAAKAEKAAEDLEKYGPIEMEPIRDLPTYHTPNPPKDTTSITRNPMRPAFDLTSFLMKAGIVAAIFLGIFFAVQKYRKSQKPVDITSYVGYSESQLADKFDLSFKDESINLSSSSGKKATARSARGLSVVYIDSKKVGVASTDKKWRMFGVGVGDKEADAKKNVNYRHSQDLTKEYESNGKKVIMYVYVDTASNSFFYFSVESGKVSELVFISDLAYRRHIRLLRDTC